MLAWLGLSNQPERGVFAVTGTREISALNNKRIGKEIPEHRLHVCTAVKPE